MFEPFEMLDSVESTNDYLLQFVAERRPRGVLAREQTAGRGRHGRSWLSPRDQGVYASFLMFPEWPSREAVWLNKLAVMAVIEALRQLPGVEGLPLAVKEPNDVLARGRKLCGVLVQSASLAERLQWAIVGIGVNLAQPHFDLSGRSIPPTSLYLEGIRPPGAREFCAILSSELARLYRGLEAGEKSRLEEAYQDLLLG